MSITTETPVEYVTRTRYTNLDLFNLAKSINKRLKMESHLFSGVHSKITRVGEGFSITQLLEIEVADIEHLKKKEIHDDDVEHVYIGALAHENAHAVIFPFMTRIDLTYSIVRLYCEEKNVKWVEPIFHDVENIISDVFNELVLVNQHIAGSEKLPKTRYLYVVKPYEKKARKILVDETNPVDALFMTHNIVFTSIYKGKIKTPLVPKPKRFSEYLYNILSKLARKLDLDKHVVSLNTGGFNGIMAPLVHMYGLFDSVDEFYTLLETKVKNPELTTEDKMTIERIIEKVPPQLEVYWFYFIVLSSYYRYAIEHNKPPSSSTRKDNLDKGKGRPRAPSPKDAKEIVRQLTLELLSPALAERASKRLLNVSLLTKKPMFETTMRSGTVKVPWYRRPRGKLDPKSLTNPSILDWKVIVRTQYPDQKRSSSSSVGIPDRVTIIMDESGSTLSETAVISPLVGVDTTVYDVERVTVMSLLLNILRFDDQVPTTLVRFSDKSEVEEGTVSDIYETLRNVDEGKLLFGGTRIVSAIEEGLKRHKDKPTNYFVLMTDMAITDYETETIKRLIREKITKSPVLVLAVNSPIPKSLEQLNKYRNVAVVSVQSLADYPKLENAIKKMVNLLK